MTTPNPRYQFKIDGVWAKPDIAMVQAFFRDHVLSFIEPIAPIANVVRGATIKEEVQFGSTEDWLSGLTAELRSAIFASYGTRHQVSFNWTFPDGLAFSATGDEPSRDDAKALVETAQTVFHLAPRELARRSSMTGTYRCAKRPDAAWLGAAIALIEGVGAAVPTATYRLASSPQIRRTARIGELQDRMSAGDPLLDWSVSGGSASLSYMANGNVTVSANGESDDAILAFIAEAQKRLDLVAIADRVTDDIGGFTRRSFMQEHPTVAWFDRLPLALAGVTGKAGSFTGRFRTINNEDMTFRAFERWRSYLEAKWDKLATAGVWQDGPDGSVNVDVDLRRELVTAIFNLKSTADVESLNKQFQDACGLKPAAPDVYKYRKYSRTYRIGEWASIAEYGRAVKRAIDIAFDNQPVVVMNAFAESGEIAPLEPFQTVQEFADYFEKDLQFRNASLLVEGFRGRHLGIHVDRDKKIFQIRGNLDLDLFNEADKQFRNAFTRSDKKDEADETSPRGNDIWKAYLASAVSIAVALIAAAWSFVSAGREPPDLKIVYPGDKAEVQGNTLDVQWTYRDPRVFGKPAWYSNYPADVQLLEAGKLAQTVRSAPGYAKLTGLHPGACTIIVSAPAGPTDSRQITVAASSNAQRGPMHR